MDLASGTGTANNTFVLSSTGRSTNEKFTGFIYSTDTTFSTSNPLVPYYQNPNNNYSNRQIVVSKGAYGIVEIHLATSNQDKPRFDKSKWKKYPLYITYCCYI